MSKNKKKEKKNCTQKEAAPPPCQACGSSCCRYVALGIDTPTCKKDYDHIRWYLLHGKVAVFVDHEDTWYIEFQSDCTMLAEDGLCTYYTERPRICRRHGVEDQTCEFFANPYQLRFENHVEFETWLEENNIKWRFKKDLS